MSQLLLTDHFRDSRTVNISPEPKKEVPLPAALWLFGSALAGFVAISKRRRV
ncbi:MAG: VPLPA-CTERM sorting domain-containing protein [Sedimenticola sp.]